MKNKFLVALVITSVFALGFYVNEYLNSNEVIKSESSTKHQAAETAKVEKSTEDIVIEYIKAETGADISNIEYYEKVVNGKTLVRVQGVVNTDSMTVDGKQYFVVSNGNITFTHGQIVPPNLDGIDCTQLVNAGFPLDFDPVTDICK